MAKKCVYFLKGLPGSGKSTWAKNFMEKYPGRAKRVNKDLLREMLDLKVWSKENEKFVYEAEEEVATSILEAGVSLIVDDTNFNPNHEKVYREIAKDWDAEFELVVIDTPLEECIERDSKRESGKVGRDVIEKMYDTYLKPTPPKYNLNLPSAVICDLDGTLAIHNGRGPYDIEKCDTDKLNDTVADIVEHSQAAFVLFVSGREDSVYDKTSRWLEQEFPIGEYNKLFMRKQGDKRPDEIVKQEIYDTHIKGKYNILFVLDDRDRVVKMWRRNGLTCLQVANGNF